MNVVIVLLVTLAVQCTLATVVGHTDPSACQRILKFLLIKACGEPSKREFRTSQTFKVMTEEEIEKRYHELVEKNMIKGVYRNDIEENNIDYDYWKWEAKDKLKDEDEIAHKMAYYKHLKSQNIHKRSVGNAPIKALVDPTEHERKGSFTFIGRMPETVGVRGRSPPPGELKRKCCGVVITCTMEDVKGFCE